MISPNRSPRCGPVPCLGIKTSLSHVSANIILHSIPTTIHTTTAIMDFFPTATLIGLVLGSSAAAVPGNRDTDYWGLVARAPALYNGAVPVVLDGFGSNAGRACIILRPATATKRS